MGLLGKLYLVVVILMYFWLLVIRCRSLQGRLRAYTWTQSAPKIPVLKKNHNFQGNFFMHTMISAQQNDWMVHQSLVIINISTCHMTARHPQSHFRRPS